MKKSLIALAALATVATAAQSQSNVTIYGVIDMGYASIDNVAKAGNGSGNVAVGQPTGRVSGLQNGGLSTSRLGFKGVEDLGGGLKAKFGLEAELLADTGSQASTPEALFARESSVALEGSFGEVKLGRFNTLGYSEGAKFDAFSGNNIGGFVAVGVLAPTRIENAVQYMTPKFNGLQAGVQTGTRTSKTKSGAVTNTYGEVADESSGNRYTGLNLSYEVGHLELSTSWGEQKDGNGTKLYDHTSVFGRYNFGFAKVVAGYYKKDINLGGDAHAGASLGNTDSKEDKAYVLGLNVPLSTNLTLNAQYEKVNYVLNNDTKRKPDVYALGLNYALSKRTTLYGIYAASSQDNGSNLGIVSSSKWNYSSSSGTFSSGAAPVADKDQKAYSVGIRHTF